MAYNSFPYSNFHELNLDYLLNKSKEIEGNVQTTADNVVLATQQADRSTQQATNSQNSAAASANSAAASAQSAVNSANSAAASAQSAEEARAAAGDPHTFTAATQLTDTSKIYVYVGETGTYTYGHYYYYQGGSWHDGGVYGTWATDDALSDSSTNAVQNRVVNAAVSELKSEIAYLQFDGLMSLPVVQGARGSTQTIAVNSKYVTSENVLSYHAGTILSIAVQVTGVQVICTEWNHDGTSAGNVGAWSHGFIYTFTDKDITITFKKGNNTDLTPLEVVFAVELITPYEQHIPAIKTVESDFSDVTINKYLQGYYNSTPNFVYSGDYVSAPIYISNADATEFVLPASDVYDFSIYTWDYVNGIFSNYTNGGWVNTEQHVSLPDGKAFSFALRIHGGGSALSVDSITYVYYKPNVINTIHSMLDTWLPKKVACVGDSLTQGVDIGTHVIAENYPYFMSKMFDCAILNYGVAGADTKEYWHDNFSTFTFNNTIDTVLIMLGTNGGGIPNTLETDVYPYTDYNEYADTYCGCYCKIIRKIMELTGNIAQIMLITPPYTSYSTAQLNRVKEARETIKAVGLYYNLPVIDAFAECGMGQFNGTLFRPHDGCHFNAKGYHRLGTYIGSKVKSYHSEWSLSDEYSDETPIT